MMNNLVIKSENIVGIFLTIYIVANIYFINTTPIYGHIIGLSLFAIAFTDSLVIKKRSLHINMPVFAYLIFVFWAVLSFFWTVNTDSYLEYQQRILLCGIVVFSLYNIFCWYNVRSYFLMGIIIGGFINLFIFLNLFPYYGIKVDEDTWRFAGTIGNSNGLSNIMSFSLFATILLTNFFARNKHFFFRFIMFVNIPACIYLIIQTGSKKGLILAVSFIFLLFLPYIKSVKGTLNALFISLFLFTVFSYLSEDADFSEQLEFVSKRFESAQETIKGDEAEESTQLRLWLLENGLKLWKEEPVLGVGLNNSKYFLGSPVHNNFLEILVNLGIVGFLIYYYFYFQIIWGSFKIKDITLKTCVMYFLIVFFIMDSTWSSYIDMFFLSILTMIIAIIYHPENNFIK